MRRSQQSGFSILELLAVLSIFLILASISLVAWNSYAPVMQLNTSTTNVADLIDLARHKAIGEQNMWGVILTYGDSKAYQTTDGGTFHLPRNSVLLFDDDGWQGWGTRTYDHASKYGGSAPQFSETYEKGGNYNTQTRHNHLMEIPELFKGPIKLERRVSLLKPSNRNDWVQRIMFDYKFPYMFWHSALIPITIPVPLNDRETRPAKIIIVDHHYQEGDTSKDNLTHRRVVVVYPEAVRITQQ